MTDRNEKESRMDDGRLPPGIIVLGPYRCATSFLSHVLSGKGVDFGPPDELYAADQWNPYGYFQRPDVLRANDDFVESAGHGPFQPPELETLRSKGNLSHLRQADLDWRLHTRIWGLKDPRFCMTLASWHEAGLLGDTTGVIRIHREPLDSARSLLQHPELVAQLDDASLEHALQVTLHYDRLADEQVHHFPGPVLSMEFENLIRETSSGQPGPCLDAIDRFIGEVLAFAAASGRSSRPIQRLA